MSIVCDTSPLSYLILVGEADILAPLFDEVLIPPAVKEELSHPEGPNAIRTWSSTPPRWLQVRSAPFMEGATVPEAFHALDPGEQDAIRLSVATEVPLIIDEKAGRRVAEELEIPVTGTIGVLDMAASEGLIDVPEVIDRLRATSFRAAPRLYRWLLDRHQ